MTISASARQKMYAQTTDATPLVLLEFDHPDNPGQGDFPAYLVNNPVAVESNGNIYQPVAFQALLPDQTGDSELPVLRLALVGPPHEMIAMVRPLQNPPTMKVSMILAEDPDTIMREWDNIVLRNVAADNLGLQFEMQYEDLALTPFPKNRYSLGNFPGLF